MYKAKAAVCSEIRTKYSTQSEYRVKFRLLNLVVRKETARLRKVNSIQYTMCIYIYIYIYIFIY